MRFPRTIQIRPRQGFTLAAGVLLAGYILYHTGNFIYSAIGGERGLTAYSHLAVLTEQARDELAELQVTSSKLEQRVSRLSPEGDGLDLEFLDERVRAVLSLADTDEFVIYLPGEADSASALQPSASLR